MEVCVLVITDHLSNLKHFHVHGNKQKTVHILTSGNIFRITSGTEIFSLGPMALSLRYTLELYEDLKNTNARAPLPTVKILTLKD